MSRLGILKDNMRLFISINVSQELQQYCRQIQSQFPGLRKTHAFHLTLQFLGNDIEDAEPIIEALRKIKFEPFEIQMGSAVPFPNASRPRGVWIECKESEALMRLADLVRDGMTRLGYEADKPFKAHITLGRYKKPPQKKMEPVTGESHRFTVDRFYLMQSTLTPSGSEYKVLAGFPK